jgi:hypothetical protein
MQEAQKMILEKQRVTTEETTTKQGMSVHRI